MAVNPTFFLIGAAILIALTLVIRHSARAALVSGLTLALIFYLIGGRGVVIWLSIASGLVLALRFLSDWNRRYRELWLDRDTTTQDTLTKEP